MCETVVVYSVSSVGINQRLPCTIVDLNVSTHSMCRESVCCVIWGKYAFLFQLILSCWLFIIKSYNFHFAHTHTHTHSRHIRIEHLKHMTCTQRTHNTSSTQTQTTYITDKRIRMIHIQKRALIAYTPPSPSPYRNHIYIYTYTHFCFLCFRWACVHS